MLAHILLHVCKQPQYDGLFGLFPEMQMTMIGDRAMQSVALIGTLLVFQQSRVHEFIQLAGSTRRNAKCRFFRKTLRFVWQDRERIEYLTSLNGQERDIGLVNG